MLHCVFLYFQVCAFHIMESKTSQCRVRHCSLCPGDTQFFCLTCTKNFCPLCKENHVYDFETDDHIVVLFHEKDRRDIIIKHKTCAKHQKYIEKYCKTCEIPICAQCSEHETHKLSYFKNVYETSRKKINGAIHIIRSESIFYRRALLKATLADFQKCRNNFCRYQSEIRTTAQKLINCINVALCNLDCKHRCLEQKVKMNSNVARIRGYEETYEQSAYKPVQFLSFIKQIKFLNVKWWPHLRLHTTEMSMPDALNFQYVKQLLIIMQLAEKGKRSTNIEHSLKLLPSPVLQSSFNVHNIINWGFDHISCLKLDQVWVSDYEELILTDSQGNIKHCFEDMYDESCSRSFTGGIHAVNECNDFFFIHYNHNIYIYPDLTKKITLFIELSVDKRRPLCVCWSPLTSELLVGLQREKHLKKTGRIVRYNKAGKQIQALSHNDIALYNEPRYIAENTNGDVVVSDFSDWSGAVVVTERDGKHRFSYRGQSSLPDSRSHYFNPCGICTDALSHILVCDLNTSSVHMIDKNGKFLVYLLTRSNEIGSPRCLSYNAKTHRLWVATKDGHAEVRVYRYIHRQKAPTEISE